MLGEYVGLFPQHVCASGVSARLLYRRAEFHQANQTAAGFLYTLFHAIHILLERQTMNQDLADMRERFEGLQERMHRVEQSWQAHQLFFSVAEDKEERLKFFDALLKGEDAMAEMKGKINLLIKFFMVFGSAIILGIFGLLTAITIKVFF